MRAIGNAVPLVRCEGGLCNNWTRGDRSIRLAGGIYKVLCDDCLRAVPLGYTQGRSWSPEEDAFLLERPRARHDSIAAALGRTRSAVQLRRKHLQVRDR